MQERLAPLVPYVAVVLGVQLLSNAWVSIVLYHATAVAIVISQRRSNTLVLLSRQRLYPGVLSLVLVASAVVGPAVAAVWSSVRRDGLDLGEALADLQLTGAAWILFIVYYATVNPLVEELFWRGHLGSAAKGIVANDLLFAGYHVFVLVVFVELPWAIAGSLALVGAAWAWRQLTRLTGGLGVPIVSHAVADASLIVAAATLV